jgi:hypothetical protein
MMLDLTPEERTALQAFPHDAVRHWLRGERYDFISDQWDAPPEPFTKPKPPEYVLEHSSGFGGLNMCERYRCPTCGHLVEYVR